MCRDDTALVRHGALETVELFLFLVILHKFSLNGHCNNCALAFMLYFDEY